MIVMDSKVETVGNTLDTLKLIVAVLIVGSGVVAFYLFAEQPLLYRVLGMLAGIGIATFIAYQTNKGQQIWGFFQGAQIEVRKVVWPTRQETVQTTLIVILMVIFIAILLWLLDMFLGWSIGSLMGRGA